MIASQREERPIYLDCKYCFASFVSWLILLGFISVTIYGLLILVDISNDHPEVIPAGIIMFLIGLFLAVFASALIGDKLRKIQKNYRKNRERAEKYIAQQRSSISLDRISLDRISLDSTKSAVIGINNEQNNISLP